MFEALANDVYQFSDASNIRHCDTSDIEKTRELMESLELDKSLHNYLIRILVDTSLFPRPSRAPARKRVWNLNDLSQDFLALLNQHDDVIQNDCHVPWAYRPIPWEHIIHLAIGIGTEWCSSTH